MNKDFAALRLKTLELNSPAPQFLESLNDILSHFIIFLEKPLLFTKNIETCSTSEYNMLIMIFKKTKKQKNTIICKIKYNFTRFYNPPVFHPLRY